MKTPWVYFAIPVAAFACSEVLAQLYAKPVGAPETPYELDGYQVQSPLGKDWFELKREKSYVYFGKKLKSRTHSFIAIAMSTPMTEKFDRPEAFLDYVFKMLAAAKDERNTIIESRAELYPAIGLFCVRHYTKAEDRDAVYAKGKALIAETYGVSCLHPDRRDLSVDVSYTERGYVAEISPELRIEGESFVRSLKFIPR
jgi:hypothetical protein